MDTMEQTMPKAHIRNGALTIPLTDEMREKLAVRDGDELDARVYKGGLTVVPATDEARQQAGQRILELIDQVRVRPGQPAMSPEEVEQMIDEEVKAVRHARRKHTAHD